MNFNQEIHVALDEIFIKNNFKIVEESKNYLEFRSPYLMVILIYNPFEKSNNLSFVTLSQNSRTIEIDNEILRNFFKSDLRLDNSDIEKFISTLVRFFEGECKSIIQGNKEDLIKLEEYSIFRDKVYTDKFK